ncbi:RNA-directed DNA polymerase, eukaryota, reverse transcriptase zinc-binding domain protein [Tanacetum coccineum]
MASSSMHNSVETSSTKHEVIDQILDLSWSKSRHNQWVLYMAASASSSMDKTVRLWDIETRNCLKVFSHSDYVQSIRRWQEYETLLNYCLGLLQKGLKINLHKSKLMGIGVSSNVVEAAASLIGCSMLTTPFNYLGVKVGSNMSRITSWDDVISKVSSRLSKWKLKLLSIGGRLTLLKSVLTSISLYHMSIFKVPIGVLNHLESIRRNFFHGVDGSDRKLVWIGWNMVQTSKQNGGLGTRFIKAIFGNKRALDTHKLMPRRSPWQDVILAIHSLQSKGINLMEYIQKKVGNGENTSFWDDSWLGEVALKVLYKRLYALETCKSISVAEKMGHTSLSHSFRRMPRGGVEQDHYDLLCSKAADLVLPNMSDRWCWSLEGSQEFSVKSTRTLIDNAILPKAEVPTRWLKVVPIKVNVHAWRVCLDKLPTRVNLSLRDIVDQVMHPLALKQTRRPRSDRGKARHSISFSSSHHQGTSSHQHNDDDDDDDV